MSGRKIIIESLREKGVNASQCLFKISFHLPVKLKAVKGIYDPSDFMTYNLMKKNQSIKKNKRKSNTKIIDKKLIQK